VKMILIREGLFVNADHIQSIEVDKEAKTVCVSTTFSYHELDLEDSAKFAKDYLGIVF